MRDAPHREGAPAPATARLPGRRRSALVLGGTLARRIAAVQAFHRSWGAGSRPLVVVDCARQEGDLSSALCGWLGLAYGRDAIPAALRDCADGTLHLESISRLAPATQRLLLALVRRLHDEALSDAPGDGPRHVAAGDDRTLPDAVARAEFSAALFDELDMFRCDLGDPVDRGAA